MKLPISLYHGSLGQIIDFQALLDSRATGCFINHNCITKNHWPKEQLTFPIYAHNVDGTPNQKGWYMSTPNSPNKLAKKKKNNGSTSSI